MRWMAKDKRPGSTSQLKLFMECAVKVNTRRQQQWWAELSTELLGDTGGYQGEPCTARTVHVCIAATGMIQQGSQNSNFQLATAFGLNIYCQQPVATNLEEHPREMRSRHHRTSRHRLVIAENYILVTTSWCATEKKWN